MWMRCSEKIRFRHPCASLAGIFHSLKIEPIRFLPQTAGMTEGRFLSKGYSNDSESSRFSASSLRASARDLVNSHSCHVEKKINCG